MGNSLSLKGQKNSHGEGDAWLNVSKQMGANQDVKRGSNIKYEIACYVLTLIGIIIRGKKAVWMMESLLGLVVAKILNEHNC